MDKHAIAHLDADLRKISLSQAAHDLRGTEPAKEVVARAQAYYDFLKGALTAKA